MRTLHPVVDQSSFDHFFEVGIFAIVSMRHREDDVFFCCREAGIEVVKPAATGRVIPELNEHDEFFADLGLCTGTVNDQLLDIAFGAAVGLSVKQHDIESRFLPNQTRRYRGTPLPTR